MLQQQQWNQLEAVAVELMPDDLTRLLDGLCLTDTHSKALANYSRSGDSDFHRLAAGVHATYVAWQIRGGAYAKYTGKQQLEGFAKHLNTAQQHLTTSFGSATYQAEAAARTVRVSMGLSEPDLAREAFTHCLALAPAHLQAHLFYFNFLTPKWFGSEEVLEEFVEAAPTSALGQLLEAMYLTELFSIHDDSSGAVQQQFRNQYDQQLAQLAARSRPLTDGSLYAVYFNNYLACLNHLLGHLAARNSFLQVLGRHITPYPWAYFGLDWAAVQKLV